MSAVFVGFCTKNKSMDFPGPMHDVEKLPNKTISHPSYKKLQITVIETYKEYVIDVICT